ncbi:hypothetical protein RDWZM_009111 [Blomia tropicalis]|uniref:Serpin domain-containing protein n=1 Tax=Blomia tropicalis TaxID=40697 RepID=A0A9Q0M326_BLOTA|nr:hypothetical protein RDWZM_009111 [Blomia tropicalis]
MDYHVHARKQTPFVLDLMKKLYQGDGSNLVVSPYSLVSALVILIPGAGGKTRFELLKTILDREATDSSKANELIQVFSYMLDSVCKANSDSLHVANMLYVQQNFELRPEYVSTLTNQFNAIGKQLDFAGSNAMALKTINDDVEKATKGLIKQLLSQIDKSTRIVLVNAIYFKGTWKNQFSKGQTNENGEFKKSNGSIVKAAMMFKKSKLPFFHDETKLKAKFVQLDYKSEGNISMVLVLPDEGNSLKQFINSEWFETDHLHSVMDKMNSSIDVILTIPRFKISCTHYLVDHLKPLGINEVFGDNADLKGITNCSEPMCVGDVIQKAVIEVNEEGTEAAAATRIRCVLCCASSNVYFDANRPFLYMLVANHGGSGCVGNFNRFKASARQVLFAGVVEDPNVSK